MENEMATYLLTWNRARYLWEDLREDINKLDINGYVHGNWSCGVTKKIEPGDRFFLIKLGKEPRGIVASGYVTSKPYELDHWEDAKNDSSQTANYVCVKFDVILDPDISILPYEHLPTGTYRKMHWSPQASGVTIPDDIAEQLETDWGVLIKKARNSIDTSLPVGDEFEDKTFEIGDPRHALIRVYERSAAARAVCIDTYGVSCAVCGFNFEATYGPIGINFIHVHHLNPISTSVKGYQLNPVRDLRPVCPNCHAMLHKRKKPYAIDELRSMLRGDKREHGQ
jgi:5-methylcytosine-specific restriction protein A